MRKSRRKSRAVDSDLPPDSAKTRQILKLLDDIDERSNAEEKTIIFSQFTSMLSLIEPFLKSRGIRYVRCKSCSPLLMFLFSWIDHVSDDGTMNKVERDAVLHKIKTSRSTRVILISFKAGSTGLNLTCCNNVILVDLWWNPALEVSSFP